jgi:hypothetical protein
MADDMVGKAVSVVVAAAKTGKIGFHPGTLRFQTPPCQDLLLSMPLFVRVSSDL